ncbi:MAG: glycosyltransferase family 4 protein [Anaerolineae bacterium]|nr:glycosyltransferase family 4 protein [Anaerolineae bacterium]
MDRIVMIGSRGVPANYGGVETYVEEVGSYLAAHGFQVAVYCHPKYVTQRGTYRGMELRFVPTIPTKHLETIVHTILSTIHALWNGADIFHYHALGPTTLAWLPRLFGRKVIATVQGLDWQRAKWGRFARWYLKLGEWATCHFPHVTIVVSRKLQTYYAQRHRKPTVYIPNGHQPPQLKSPEQMLALGLTPDDYILFVGRLTPEKGCHTLLQAFARVRTDKTLVLAGQPNHDAAYYQELQRLATGPHRVYFAGFVQGDLLRELYSNAYLVVHPSEIEGLSVSLLEARSYGNCLLVSDILENLEVLDGHGYQFRVGNVTDLTERLQWLSDHPEAVQADRAKARQITQTDWDGVGQATLSVYHKICQDFLDKPIMPT